MLFCVGEIIVYAASSRITFLFVRRRLLGLDDNSAASDEFAMICEYSE